MNEIIDPWEEFNFDIENHENFVKSPSDIAFWKIDEKVVELFDQFMVRDNLPTHNNYQGKIKCRSFFNEHREIYDELYFESVEKACELVKHEDPLAYQELVDEHEGEDNLIRSFKFN